jgi:AraC-like DNA-binding protein
MFAHVGVIVGAIVIKPALTSLFHLERSNVVPVTMRDVARKVGVSIRTVSRAIQKQGEITQETRQRVLAAVEEPGYRPSKVARASHTSRRNYIAQT